VLPSASPTSGSAPSPGRTATHRPTASPKPTAAPPALAADFESEAIGANPPSGWHVDDGRWVGVVDDGGHVLRHSGAQALSHLTAGSAEWSDYTVSADVTTDLLDLGYAGVAGRYQGPGDHYECDVSVGGQLQLWLVKGGARRSLDLSGISLDLSGRHTVALEMRGSRLTCSLDGVALLHATDATFASGRIALVASAGEAVEFDNVHVTS
jgi:pectate lyase